ncbi:DnaJ domain-containing protein [Diplocarpon rosae]|nr:DnaJ domain-containing protein [Diplocarpon rosae]
MVKADLTRDYYGDLDLPPTAEVAEIKRQFKKLALAYHPDRNPGRESEVTAKFQKIQSAHEVLIDPLERAKYDSNRVRPSRYGGQSSGVRGNPWSSAGSAFPPPPKAPTAQRSQRPPPPSTGARKYDKFTTQQQSAYTAFEGPGARTATYQAWEHLRHNQKPTETGPGKSWGAPQPPPRGTPQSGREESNARRHAPPPKAGPGFEEFREANSPRRSQSTNASSRKGFMPSTPGGGDEGPAPMGAYFTDRNKPAVAPEVPPREPPPKERPQASTRPIPNPLKQFQDKAMVNEPRISTPYSTHGGEKFNPFESTNVNRSKSTKERPEHVDSDFLPRNGSGPNLNSPSRARPFAQRNSPRASKSATETVNLDSSSESSSDGSLNTNGRPHRSDSMRTNGGGTRTAAPPQGPPGASVDSDTSKQSELARLRQWMLQNPGQEPPPDGPPDGQVPRSSRPQAQPQAQTNEETMYANSDYVNFDRKKFPNFSVKLPTVSETISSGDGPAARGPPPFKKYFMDNRQPMTSPSGVQTDPQSLNAFEGFQRNVIDQLLHNKRTASLGQKSSSSPGFAETPVVGHPYDFDKSREFWDGIEKLKSQANHPERSSSFSFNVNDDIFSRTGHPSSGFSNSAENISTKFTPEDWDGKFEAGADYFKPKPDQKSRTQSISRTRGRSPVKVRPIEPKIPKPREAETPTESPNGTKFSADEWKETFKPQTFMPPPPMPRMASTPSRKRTGPTTRPTVGNAAVVDDDDTSDEKSLFTGRKNMASAAASPEPMDVDTPPASHVVPQYVTTPNGHLKVGTESSKRAASASELPIDSESLKVNFDDLRIRDLMSTLAMPSAPQPPALPEAASEYERPTRAAYDDYIKGYAKYIGEWDLFNSKFLLHMVARKNQNDTLKDRRWNEERASEIYRMGLKEDQAVLKRWTELHESHELVVKSFLVMRERMKTREEREGAAAGRSRPRKKTH